MTTYANSKVHRGDEVLSYAVRTAAFFERKMWNLRENLPTKEPYDPNAVDYDTSIQQRLIFGVGGIKTPKCERATEASPAKLCQVKQQHFREKPSVKLCGIKNNITTIGTHRRVRPE